jgi:hypothetical protein
VFFFFLKTEMLKHIREGGMQVIFILFTEENHKLSYNIRPLVSGVPVTTAWCVFRLWMEEWPLDVGDSCEYIE